MCLLYESFENTVGKGEIARNEQTFSHSVFYPFEELSSIFIKFKTVVCKLFQFGRVQNLSFGKELRLYQTTHWHLHYFMKVLPLVSARKGVTTTEIKPCKKTMHIVTFMMPAVSFFRISSISGILARWMLKLRLQGSYLAYTNVSYQSQTEFFCF